MSNLTKEMAKEHNPRYKRMCDGCGKIVERNVMVSVFRGKEGEDVGVHLCRVCAGRIIRKAIEKVRLTKVEARRVYCRVRSE